VLARHTDAIKVFYVPSYSPELNPDEMANADIKQAVTKQAPAFIALLSSPANSRRGSQARAADVPARVPPPAAQPMMARPVSRSS